MYAVTRTDVIVTLHVLAVVVAFGGALTYPIWFRMVRNGTAEQRAFFHAAQARLGKFVIAPGCVIVFATGAYLASDFHVWSSGWVLLPTIMLVVILAIGGVFLGPSEERLSKLASAGELRGYQVLFARVRAATWFLAVLVVVATFLMIAHVPD